MADDRAEREAARGSASTASCCSTSRPACRPTRRCSARSARIDAEKAGHTGTLDPLASGLLPLCFGEATKFAQLPARRRQDATSPPFASASTTTTRRRRRRRRRDGTGDARSRGDRRGASRVPRHASSRCRRAHSALKYRGRSHYEYAREGIDVPRAAPRVAIHALDLDRLAPARRDARRSIAARAHTSACWPRTSARRSAAARTWRRCVGRRPAASRSPTPLRSTALEALSDGGAPDALLLPVDALLADLPPLDVDDAAARDLRHGRRCARDGATEHAVRARARPAGALARRRPAKPQSAAGAAGRDAPPAPSPVDSQAIFRLIISLFAKV